MVIGNRTFTGESEGSVSGNYPADAVHSSICQNTGIEGLHGIGPIAGIPCFVAVRVIYNQIFRRTIKQVIGKLFVIISVEVNFLQSTVVGKCAYINNTDGCGNCQNGQTVVFRYRVCTNIFQTERQTQLFQTGLINGVSCQCLNSGRNSKGGVSPSGRIVEENLFIGGHKHILIHGSECKTFAVQFNSFQERSCAECPVIGFNRRGNLRPTDRGCRKCIPHQCFDPQIQIQVHQRITSGKCLCADVFHGTRNAYTVQQGISRKHFFTDFSDSIADIHPLDAVSVRIPGKICGIIINHSAFPADCQISVFQLPCNNGRIIFLHGCICFHTVELDFGNVAVLTVQIHVTVVAIRTFADPISAQIKVFITQFRVFFGINSIRGDAMVVQSGRCIFHTVNMNNGCPGFTVVGTLYRTANDTIHPFIAGQNPNFGQLVCLPFPKIHTAEIIGARFNGIEEGFRISVKRHESSVAFFSPAMLSINHTGDNIAFQKCTIFNSRKTIDRSGIAFTECGTELLSGNQTLQVSQFVTRFLCSKLTFDFTVCSGIGKVIRIRHGMS